MTGGQPVEKDLRSSTDRSYQSPEPNEEMEMIEGA